MPKWIVRWNAGYGDDYEVIEAADKEEALKAAYDHWRQNVEDNADYDAMPYSKEDAIDYGLEEEEPDADD